MTKLFGKPSFIRDRFEASILERDQHRCRVCQQAEGVQVARIRDDLPRLGYVAENSISLCAAHLAEAKARHMQGALPDNLYQMIGSSRVAATRASLYPAKFVLNGLAAGQEADKLAFSGEAAAE